MVSRLLWRVFSDRWGDQTRLMTLLEDSGPLDSLDSSTATRLRFGTALAGGQAFGQCPWVFYSHMSVARVQSFVPAPFRRPYGVFLHGIEAWQPLAPPQRRVLQGAAVRIANSRFTADRVLEANPDVGPIAVCPLTLEPDLPRRRDPIRHERLRAGGHAVLIVARMSSAECYKGHDELLEAWPMVKAHQPGRPARVRRRRRRPSASSAEGARAGHRQRDDLHGLRAGRRAAWLVRRGLRLRDAEPRGGLRPRVPRGDVARPALHRIHARRGGGDHRRRCDRLSRRPVRSARARRRAAWPAHEPRAPARHGRRAAGAGSNTSSASRRFRAT